MEKEAKTTTKPATKIEIRQQDNHFIVGRFPSWLSRWGNAAIIAVLLLLLYVAFNLKFPLVVPAQVSITDDGVFLLVPKLRMNEIKDGQEANLRIDDFPYMDYGILRGKITLARALDLDNAVRIPVTLADEQNRVKTADLLSGMQGTGEIIIDKIPVIYRIIDF
jgi:hypothetical protein